MGLSNYHLKGASKKLNISIRMFKRVEDWILIQHLALWVMIVMLPIKEYIMPNYITDKVFSDDELRNMDIFTIQIKLFEDQYEDSYTIDNFISEKEKDTLIDFYEKYKMLKL